MKKILILLISFVLSSFCMVAQTSKKVVAKKAPVDNTVYEVVDKLATFPGGLKSMVEFMQSELKYPQDAMEKNKEGRVMVSFVVNKDGTIQDVKIQKGVDPSLDSEAIRMVRSMPLWTPAERDGKIVRSRYTLPVLFKIKIK